MLESNLYTQNLYIFGVFCMKNDKHHNKQQQQELFQLERTPKPLVNKLASLQNNGKNNEGSNDEIWQGV